MNMMNATFSGRTSRFKLIKIYDKITSETLRQEIARRKLSYELANEYLYQAYVMDRKSQRKSIAFAFPNIRDHYEITIPYPTKGKSIKTSITQNTFTYIEGEQSNCVEIFRNVWDFLTWLTMMKQTVNKYDAYILNGRNSLPDVIEVIRGRADKVKNIMDFTDNEESGDCIRDQFADLAEGCNMRYGAQNYIYSNYISLSEYWMKGSQVQSLWPIT